MAPLLILYAISCVISLAMLLWDASRCYDIRVRDLGLYTIFAICWPGMIVLFILTYTIIWFLESKREIDDKVIIRRRNRGKMT